MSSTCQSPDLHGSPCGNPATFRFRFPGFSEERICARHAVKARMLAETFKLPIRESDPGDAFPIKNEKGLILLEKPLALVTGDYVLLAPLRADIPDAERIRSIVKDAFNGKR